MQNSSLTISLIISVYNKPTYLHLALLSVERQSLLPLEVIVADDGSKPDVKQVVNQWKERLKNKCSVCHVWQEDKGFRKSRILNKALAQAKGQYVVMTDCDIIMHKHFLKDHQHFALQGYYVSGGRALTSEKLMKTLTQSGNYQLSPFTKGVSHRLNACRLPFITPLFYGRGHIRGCNMAFFLNDAKRINGYDERFVTYGYEDGDFAARLERSGIKRRKLKFCAVAYHLYHNEWFDGTNDNTEARKVFLTNEDNQVVRCSEGLNLHQTNE